MVFKIYDHETKESMRWMHLAPGIPKNQYDKLEHGYDVKQYCDKFKIGKSHPFAKKTGYWLDWQLGDEKLCKSEKDDKEKGKKTYTFTSYVAIFVPQQSMNLVLKLCYSDDCKTKYFAVYGS